MGGYRLERSASGAAAPTLDADQRRVVEHRGGPLLVLAGPGTGKTTTLIEAVVARLAERRPGPGDPVPLVLTASRRAATDLRQRITERLGRSTSTPLAMTIHSFCYALLRRFADSELFDRLRLLTAPEQEFRVRETLAGDLESGLGPRWPESVRAAYATRAFAAEVRTVLARARQLGMDPEDLEEVAREAGRPEWEAVGAFMAEYLEVLDFEGVLDYSELVHRCRILLTDAEVAETLWGEIDGIYVDEYQDTDPAQVQLLRSLAGPPMEVVAFGDPNQSIFGFRGALARSILDFDEHFKTAQGSAPITVLRHNHRQAVRLQQATARVAGRLPLGRLPDADLVREFLNPQVVEPASRGRVEVHTCESEGAEAEHIADLLRQAHLHEGLPWSEMAVLVRAGRRTLPMLTRALTAAGVPIEVAGDEIALAAELAVRPLLLALKVVAKGRAQIDADEAARLLTSPLGGLDSVELRRLGRLTRETERIEMGGVGVPPSSTELVRRLVADPQRIAEVRETLGGSTPELDQACALAELLETTDAAIADGASAEEALWTLWQGTDWPQRLNRASRRGGDSGTRADRDLDAVCALFEVAARSEEVVGHRGVSGFLAEVESQQIPADTQRESDVSRRGVRLLTAHRAKGLEWELVVIASVQEGVWPDLRVRGSLLEADRLGRVGGRWGLTDPAPPSVRLAEERRLFYVACTRARRRLVVTAVSGTEGEGDQPSRFVSELGVEDKPWIGRPTRPLNLTGLVGELRAVSVDPDEPAAVREAAAVRLARLADATDDEGVPLVPAADPRAWWGMRDLSASDQPVVPEGEPVSISGSQLAGLLSCPRQWFLDRKASAQSGRNSAASFGDIVHLLVDHAATDGLELDELNEKLDAVWDSMEFDAHYLSAQERMEAENALARYAGWVEANSHRELLGTEVRFRVPVEIDGEEVVLTGSADRLERGGNGLYVVDFKTGRTAPAKKEIPGHEQLGVYQLAASAGAFDRLTDGDRRVAGAELVYLRQQEKTDDPYPKVFVQESIDVAPHLVDPAAPEAEPSAYPTWVHEKISSAVRTIRSERFDARPGGGCDWCAFSTSCPARSTTVVQ